MRPVSAMWVIRQPLNLQCRYCPHLNDSQLLMTQPPEANLISGSELRGVRGQLRCWTHTSFLKLAYTAVRSRRRDPVAALTQPKKKISALESLEEYIVWAVGNFSSDQGAHKCCIRHVRTFCCY